MFGRRKKYTSEISSPRTTHAFTVARAEQLWISPVCKTTIFKVHSGWIGEHTEAFDCVIIGHIENEAEHGVVVYNGILSENLCMCVGEWIAGDFVEAFHHFICSFLLVCSSLKLTTWNNNESCIYGHERRETINKGLILSALSNKINNLLKKEIKINL
jgi:hypothetical protein